MIVDDCLFATIIAGIGLSGAYFKAEYQLHVRLRTAARKTGVVLHDLHTSRVRIEQNGIPVHARITREPTQPQLFRTIRFLTRHPHSAQEHRTH
jgi:hypothetical protein